MKLRGALIRVPATAQVRPTWRGFGVALAGQSRVGVAEPRRGRGVGLGGSVALRRAGVGFCVAVGRSLWLSCSAGVDFTCVGVAASLN